MDPHPWTPLCEVQNLVGSKGVSRCVLPVASMYPHQTHAQLLLGEAISQSGPQEVRLEGS